jgi:hypothetical protein
MHPISDKKKQDRRSAAEAEVDAVGSLAVTSEFH